MPDIAALRAAIIANASTFGGYSYRLDPPPSLDDGTIDCSLFVLEDYRRAGVPFPAGIRTAEQIRQACTVIGWDDVRPGDLLFFEGTYDAGPPSPDGHIASHIGISLGTGTGKMWDAHDGRSGTTDAVGLTIINPSTYWQGHIFEARRHPALMDTAPAIVPQAAMPRGVDVASYQGRPDWAAVRAAGYTFGVTKMTEGLDYMNPTAGYNWAGMAAQGIKRGGYHWGRPSQDARQQVSFFWDAVGQAGGWRDGDVLVLDIEESGGDEAVWAEAFMDALDDRIPAEACVIYTGAWFTQQEQFADNITLARYALWLAAYQAAMPPAPAPWDRVTFWQYSSTGQVPGISGAVDLDMFNGTADALTAFGRRAAPPVTPPEVYVRPGDVGSGILGMMTEDGTVPIMPSIWHPLGRGPADALAEEAIGINGVRYLWHLPTGRAWRYHPATEG